MVNYGASKKRITLDHLFLTFKLFFGSASQFVECLSHFADASFLSMTQGIINEEKLALAKQRITLSYYTKLQLYYGTRSVRSPPE